jgi:ABC-2 type transport system ATP-binding protein
MSDAAVQLEDVTKRYGAHHAVRDLSFAIARGTICGFLGPNGAGKTTTIRMILGLVAPTRGRVVVLGSTKVRKARDRVGFLPEERGLYKRMTPVEAVAFFASLKGVPTKEGRRRAVELLEAQGLGDALKKPIKALSKGMAQKVQLAAAVAHEPDRLILDEPFSGLDPVNQEALEAVIQGMARPGRHGDVRHPRDAARRAAVADRVIGCWRAGEEGVRRLGAGGAKGAAPRVIILEGGPDARRACEAGPRGGGGVVAGPSRRAAARVRLSHTRRSPCGGAARGVRSGAWTWKAFEMKEAERILHELLHRPTGQDARGRMRRR